MPKAHPTVASFWVIRDAEHPGAFNYAILLAILQTSCDRLGLRHIVLTDRATLASDRWPAGIEGWASDLPQPLMQACTAAQANYLESGPSDGVIFVGADCIFIRDPVKQYPGDVDLCVTYRSVGARYPINNGFMAINRHAIGKVAALYRRVADRCGTTWCDDQRSLIAELSPMPDAHGTFDRAGLRVCFMPMKRFNSMPRTIDDPVSWAVALHFRGKRHSEGLTRKDFMVAWAKAHGFA